MLRYLLDTNVLAEPVAKTPDKRVLRMLERHQDECAIAAPVVHEIRYGIEILEPSRRRTAYEQFLDEVVLPRYPVLPYDHRAAEWHARERARQHRLGVKRPYSDGLIAAIAAVHDLVVVTANVRDFKHYEGLAVETWKR